MVGIAALAIIGPLAAAILAPLARGYAGAVALFGAATGLLGALVTLARVERSATVATTLPGLPDLPLRLAVDPLGAVLSTVVAVVSTFVLLYATGYMAGERDTVRFFAAMSLFVAAMQALVLADDWLLLLAAWELVGLASYLLIGFWFTEPGVGAAATRAFLVTRAADLGLYLGVLVIIAETGTSAMGATGEVGGTAATIAGLALLLAAAGKSAQAPLQGWLMDAMAGPMPVSALLHAATLVVAGVVLLARAFPLMPDGVLLVVGLVAGVSAVITGLTAIAQQDLKRLLAASTSSQLGLMLLALGAGSVPAALFHLVTHAAMKSSLFLAAGVFQHDRHATGFSELAGVGRERRLTFAAFAVAGFALTGVPPLAGFWSKDAVIAATLGSPYATLLTPLAVVASALTGVYVGRALRTLWGDESSPVHSDDDGVAGHLMGAGLAVLAILAATTGLLAEPFTHLLNAELPESMLAMSLGLAAAAVGLLAGWLVPAERLLGPALETVRTGFRIGNGWTDFVAAPSLVLARRCDSLDSRVHAFVLGAGGRVQGTARSANTVDTAIHTLVLGTGRRALAMAATVSRVDTGVHHGVLESGRRAMDTANAAHGLDMSGIDAAIRELVAGTVELAHRTRQLQSGLVHRELLLTVGGTVAILILVLIV